MFLAEGLDGRLVAEQRGDDVAVLSRLLLADDNEVSSQIAASIIESPCTSSMNKLPVPVSRTGNLMTSSTCCSAVIGTPAAIAPTSGTSCKAV